MSIKDKSDSTLLSPLINRTSTYPRLCLKFKYMMFGKGSMSLRFSVKTTSTYSIAPVWIDKDNAKMDWKYAEIPIRSMVPFQVGKMVCTKGHLLQSGFYMVKNDKRFFVGEQKRRRRRRKEEEERRRRHTCPIQSHRFQWKNGSPDGVQSWLSTQENQNT